MWWTDIVFQSLACIWNESSCMSDVGDKSAFFSRNNEITLKLLRLVSSDMLCYITVRVWTTFVVSMGDILSKITFLYCNSSNNSASVSPIIYRKWCVHPLLNYQ